MARSQSDSAGEGQERGKARGRKKSLFDPDHAAERAAPGIGPSKIEAEQAATNRAETQMDERLAGRPDRRGALHDPDRVIEGRDPGERGERSREPTKPRHFDADRIVGQRRKGDAAPALSDGHHANDAADPVRSVYVDTSITEIANISASTRTIEEELRRQGPRDGAHSAFAHKQVQGEMGEVMAGKYLEQNGYRPLSPHGKSTEHGLDHIAWSPDGTRVFVGETKNHDSTKGYESGDRMPGDHKGVWLDDHTKVRSAIETQTRNLPKEERQRALKAFDDGRVDRGVFLYGETRPSPVLIERAKVEGWTIYQLKPRVKTYDRVTPRDEAE